MFCRARAHRYDTIRREAAGAMSCTSSIRGQLGKQEPHRNGRAQAQSPKELVFADDGQLLLRLVARRERLLADNHHGGVGRALLDDLALLVGTTHDVELGCERWSGGADQEGYWQDILDHCCLLRL